MPNATKLKKSDEKAEKFVDSADQLKDDLSVRSEMKPKDKSVNLRLPSELLETVSKRSEMLPLRGSVLGVDVGYSTNRKSSAICRIDWTENTCSWALARFRAVEPERSSTIAQVSGDSPIEAAAFDGPLRGGLDHIGRYRLAECVLTKGFQPLIGKPGQSNSPVGRSLNEAANKCASAVINSCKARLVPAQHTKAIHSRAIAEAFPSAFLGVMIESPASLNAKRKGRSDIFFKYLIESGTLHELLRYLLPNRKLGLEISTITNHDERAAFVCALTALCVASRDFMAVGDQDGWIILPPQAFVMPWAIRQLKANSETLSCLHVEMPT